MKQNSKAIVPIVFATLAFMSTSVLAQADGGCAAPPVVVKASDAAISQFKANPLALISTFASAGFALSTEARSLLLADPGLIDALLDAAKSGNDAQRAAIGAGLAQASRIIVCTKPQIAADIQHKVAQSGLTALIVAYIAGSNGTETAALGAGGADGGGSGPTGGIDSPGGSISNGDAAAATNSFRSTNASETSSSGFSFASSSVTGGLTITRTSSVSPSR